MNRRSFFKRVAQVTAGAVAAVSVLKTGTLVPEMGTPQAYRTYVMGANAFMVADLRKLKQQLASRNVKPINGNYIGYLNES